MDANLDMGGCNKMQCQCNRDNKIHENVTQKVCWETQKQDAKRLSYIPFSNLDKLYNTK